MVQGSAMEEEAIDEWYDKEKKRLDDEFHDAVGSGKDVGAAEKRFKQKMNTLRASYEERVEKYIEHEKKKIHKKHKKASRKGFLKGLFS